jgi:DNA-binding transcriptional regulator YhcF (GntR family)
MVDELEMEPEEAIDRTEQQGKDPSGKKDKKSEYYHDKNFITRATLSEIQKQKAIKMVEDLLMNKKNSDNSEVGKKESSSKEASNILKKNLKSLLKQMDKEGLSRKDILKLLDGE